MKNLLALASGLLSIVYTGFGQNFNYSMTKDSMQYIPLNASASLVAPPETLNKPYHIHLPFSVNFCGSVTDSILYETNGFLLFNKASELAMVIFNSYGPHVDSLGNAVYNVKTELSGPTGHRIFKVQFTSLSQNYCSYTDHLEFQLWLYENGGRLEVHIGQLAEVTTDQYHLVGLINRNMDTTPSAVTISREINSYSLLSSGQGEDLHYIQGLPSAGTVFSFIPNF